MNRKSLFSAGAAAALLLASGCGSSSKSTTGSSNASASAPTTTASTAASGGGAYGHTPAAASAGGSSGGAGVAVSTKHSKLGTILAAGPKHMTVYLFEADKNGTSACTGACAGAWPPVTTSGSPSASGAAVSGDLGTIMRPDGTKQVTYKGHPLYFFVRDKDGGDAYGEGVKAFGASWYVLEPSGAKVDNS